MQSCNKPISYLIAVQENGFDVVHHHVGTEASGAKFDNLDLKDAPTEKYPNRKM